MCNSTKNTQQYEPIIRPCANVKDSFGGGILILIFVTIFLIVLFSGLWYLAGTNEEWRQFLARVIPEKYLPTKNIVKTTALYQQLGTLDGEGDDDALEINVDPGSDKDDNDSLSSSSSSKEDTKK